MLCTRNENSVLGQLYFKTNQNNKQKNSEKKRSDLWLPEAGGGGKGNWIK